MGSIPPTATYNLVDVQELVRAGAWIVSSTALRGAASLGWDSEDVKECILALTATDFHKTMPSTDCPGLWQDVYKPLFRGVRLYVKIQVAGRGKAVVISFKEK